MLNSVRVCKEVMIVAESAAEGEPAWKGSGQEVGLQIWRIVVSTQVESIVKQ